MLHVDQLLVKHFVKHWFSWFPSESYYYKFISNKILLITIHVCRWNTIIYVEYFFSVTLQKRIKRVMIGIHVLFSRTDDTHKFSSRHIRRTRQGIAGSFHHVKHITDTSTCSATVKSVGMAVNTGVGCSSSMSIMTRH